MALRFLRLSRNPFPHERSSARYSFDVSTPSPRRAATVIAGIALLVLPLVALLLKVASPGWVMVIIVIFGGIPMLGAYSFAIVVAVTGFFRRTGRFRDDTLRSLRGRFSAWLHGASLVLAAFFVTDVGDSAGAYSPFMTLFGLSDTGLVQSLSDILTVIFLVTSIGAYVWLVVEWALAGRARRRASAV
jgi:hypothetical protein